MGIPEMRKRGYPDGVASGAIAAGGTLGILIPPSVTMIVYGIATETSIGRLFLAGVLPGVVVGLCIGADCLFDRASEAPVTHLFVKDRSLANNPIGALYSEHYLRESANPISLLGAADASWPARLRALTGHSALRET